MLKLIHDLIQNWGDIAVGAGAILGALWTLYFKFLKPKIIKPVADKFDKIDKISYALGPNGGTSLYDKIHSIDKKTSLGNVRSEALNATLGIAEWQSDEDGHCIRMNAVGCMVTNRPESDFLGSNWMNVVHEEDRERVIHEWDNSVKHKKDFLLVYRWTSSDGDSLYIDVIGKPIYDSSGKIIGYLGTAKFLGNKKPAD